MVSSAVAAARVSASRANCVCPSTAPEPAAANSTTRAQRRARFRLTATWVGIRFQLGAALHDLSVAGLVDRSLTLPPAGHRSFWWKGTAWRLPTYDNAEGLVERLVREDLIGSEPVVDDALGGTSAELSLRTIQRRSHAATGLTRRAVRQIERARLAGVQLREGATPAEVTHEFGYYDQPHLTRSLRRFLGQTPAELADPGRDEQLSLLVQDRRRGVSCGALRADSAPEFPGPSPRAACHFCTRPKQRAPLRCRRPSSGA